MWRPIYAFIAIWTPLNSGDGVRSALLSCFGRHLPDYMASVPAALHNLDASHIVTWRPFRTSSPIWTPLNSGAGVRSARLSRFGRHTHNQTASNFAALLKLDATHSITRRPFCSASPIWTPHTQSHGVQFCCSSQVGRHSTRTPASVPAALHNLDASRTHCWRPFRTSSPIWTPLQSTFGVQSTLSSPFERHATFRRHATSEFTRQYPRNSAK